MAPKSSQKRVAAKSPPKHAPSKKAKAVVDPFLEICTASLAHLDEDESLTDGARDMIRTSAPFALRPGKADRHKFQDIMVTKMLELLQKIDAGRADSLQAAEGKVAEIQGHKAMNDELVDTLLKKESEGTDAKKASDDLLEEAENVVATTKEALSLAKQAVTDSLIEQTSIAADKDEREKLINETWTQLKDGTIPGRQWREKNKLIERIVAVLQQQDVEASCIDALPVALKEKSVQRGPIAVKCLEHVDAQLQKSVQELSGKIDRCANKIVEKKEALIHAEEKLKEAELVRDDRVNEAIRAQNILLEASEKHKTAKHKSAEIAVQAAEVAELLTTAEGECAKFKATLARFEAILENGEAGAVALEAAAPTTAMPEGDAAATA